MSPTSREQDRREFADFCHREYGPLVGFLHLYCGSVEIAEDFAQEALARAWRDWRRLRGAPYLSGWVRRVGINVANSHFRRRAAEKRARARLEGNLVEERDNAAAIALLSALRGLPPRQRAAIVLRYYEQYKFQEIAEVLDCGISTAKSLAARAVDALRNEFLDEEKELGHAKRP